MICTLATGGHCLLILEVADNHQSVFISSFHFYGTCFHLAAISYTPGVHFLGSFTCWLLTSACSVCYDLLNQCALSSGKFYRQYIFLSFKNLPYFICFTLQYPPIPPLKVTTVAWIQLILYKLIFHLELGC